MGKIRWAEKASSHLQTIHEYIARDSKIYATRFIRSLIKATTKLETMPRIGRVVPELENYGFREVIYQNYRIVYRITGDEDVEILAVLHAARNFKKAFYEEWELK
ncbi:MAG: type II toxin-antitoxin system RelE/ParE family toxin [Nitrospiraceae bacterium]|nr:type II toxin-antitoxin system RelE/ParE family toxin [Nitrospiraceae bacterium]MDA8223323.1 type II toxin-antitoxin system RelE/ParE family toxin [Desulfitobacterium hafniense]